MQIPYISYQMIFFYVIAHITIFQQNKSPQTNVCFTSIEVSYDP